MPLIGHLTNFITHFIATTGYTSIFLLMIFESTALPIPSESVLPFAGFLVADGQLNFWLVGLAATLGSLTGSLVSYLIGKHGGYPLLNKYGHYVLLNHEELNKAEKFFAAHGEITIFIGRFIPVVRHLISIPAGVAKMNLTRFCFYSVLGAGLWNVFLVFAGTYFRDLWLKLMVYGHWVDLVILLALIILVVWFVRKKRKRNKII